MIAPPGDNLPRLAFHERDEGRIAGRDVVLPGAGLNELLPDQDAEPVAAVIKRFLLDQAAAPHAQDIDVRLPRQRQQMVELFRPLDAVHQVQRDPVPPLEVDFAPVDLGRVGAGGWVGRIVGHEFQPADAECHSLCIGLRARCRVDHAHARLVERLLAVPVRPPQRGALEREARRPDFALEYHAAPVDHGAVTHHLDFGLGGGGRVERHPHGDLGPLKVVSQYRAHPHIGDPLRPGDIELHAVPNASMHQARAEVPPVGHAALMRADQARPPDLRLFIRRRLDHDCQQVLRAEVQQLAHLEQRRGVHPAVRAQPFPIEVKLRLVVHPVKAERRAAIPQGFRHGETRAINPHPLRHPLARQRVAPQVGIWNLTRLPGVVRHAAGDGRRQPAARVARVRQVSAAHPPVHADERLALPAGAVQRETCVLRLGHGSGTSSSSSKLVSMTGCASSRGTRSVLISDAPKRTAITRSPTRISASVAARLLS